MAEREFTIKDVRVEEIKDSRGNPTFRVTVIAGNHAGSFAVPSGASTGAHEALELRDADGKGIKKAMENIKTIIRPALLGKDVRAQKEIDDILLRLDGTPNKSKLGGNSMIGVSAACAKAAALASGMETFEYIRSCATIVPSYRTPYCYMNLINGGKHAANGLAFQEYLLVPDAATASEAVEVGKKVQRALEEILREKFGEGSLALGDEGGFAVPVTDVREPLRLLTEAVRNVPEAKARLALDAAATSFYHDGSYTIDGKKISKKELLELYVSLLKEFDIVSIEDPFYEEDFESFGDLKKFNHGVYIVGDDLTVTNTERLQKAIEAQSISAMIIKPNQIGTLTETLEAMKLARDHGIELIVSHRSGETEDDFIADLAYAFGCFGLKAGAPRPAERLAKYERLMTIETL